MIDLPLTSDELVREIIAINQAWKLTRESETYGPSSPMAREFRNLKSRLQVRLLRQYPQLVYLEIDDMQEEEGEPLFGVRLRRKIWGRSDAAHLPCRVAEELLEPSELENFLGPVDN